MKNWKIRSKLLALAAVLIGFIVLLAGVGHFGMQSTVRGLETVYLDRVVPLRDLKIIADMYAVNIVDASHKARAGILTHAEALAQIEQAQTTIDERWKAYIATRLTPEEAKVVAEVGPMMTAAEAPLEKLKQVLRQGDPEGLAAFVTQDLYPLVDPFSDAFARLLDIQLVEAKREFDAGEETFHHSQLFNVIAGVLAVVIGIASATLVTRQITAQLGAEPQDLDVVATDIANGRLAGASSERASLEGVMGSIERMRASLHELVGQIAGGADRLGTNAARLASASKQVTARAATQGEASESMAAALEELSASIALIADNTADAERVAAHANEAGESGLRVIRAAIDEFDRIDRLMSDSSQRMNRLSEDSKSIGTIGSVIRDIAEQTNLLALNAAIEAARAGDQGRGFAVVADEVRKLAERTSVSTGEIVQLVTTIQEGTSGTRQQMNAVCEQVVLSKEHISEAGRTVTELRDAIKQTLMNVESISLSLNEQRTASTEVAARVEQVAQAVEETAATQKEVSLAAQDLNQLATELNSVVSRFSL